MPTPETGTRQVHPGGDPPASHAVETSEEQLLPASQLIAFAGLVANDTESKVAHIVAQMSREQLQALVVALATQVNTSATATGTIPDAGPDVICAIAVTAAAQSLGTTSDAVLSADRHRAVTDARAVAMTAARRGGATLPAIAAHFGKDHTTVMTQTCRSVRIA